MNGKNQMKSVTVEEFQENWDEYINLVENGESIQIRSEYGTAVMVPYKEYNSAVNTIGSSLEEIYTNHDEAS